nr:MAG TPA: WSK motif protein [Caudoviricetes sp.]
MTIPLSVIAGRGLFLYNQGYRGSVVTWKSVKRFVTF